MKTKHGDGCRMAFGRLSAAGECARCDELASGAPARSWSAPARYRGQTEKARIEAIRAHNCKAARCGTICTYGDW
jgi:hypothetical protein